MRKITQAHTLICRNMRAFSSVTELIRVAKQGQNHQYKRTKGMWLNIYDLSPDPFQGVIFQSNQCAFPTVHLHILQLQL